MSKQIEKTNYCLRYNVIIDSPETGDEIIVTIETFEESAKAVLRLFDEVCDYAKKNGVEIPSIVAYKIYPYIVYKSKENEGA